MSLKDNLLKAIPLATASLILGGVALWRIDELRLGKKDFQKAEWIEYNSDNENLWNAYINEKTNPEGLLS